MSELSTVTPDGNEKRGGELQKGPPLPPKSAFSCFFTAEVRKGNCDKTEIEPIANKFNDLPEEERHFWEQEALKDKERYSKQKLHYNGWDLPKRRAKKDPRAPKRP